MLVQVVLTTAFIMAKTAFTYILPDGEVYSPGLRVEVPFGRSNKTEVGVLVGIGQDDEASKYKKIIRVLDRQPLFNNEMLQLFEYIYKENMIPLGQAISYLMPPIQYEQYHVKDDGKAVFSGHNRSLRQWLKANPEARIRKSATRQEALWNYLIKNGITERDVLKNSTGIPQSVISQMLDQGSVVEVSAPEKQCMKIALNEEQRLCADGIIASKKPWHLLYGVTSSGKTEVYIELIKETLKQGKQALVLVPEIGLIHQMVSRIEPYFNEDVAVLSSKEAMGIRAYEWINLKNGTTSIAVGVRSGITASFNNLGLIIIDEMHDSSYEPMEGSRYNVLETALFRCETEKCKLVMGSATPSISYMHRALAEGDILWLLKNRYKNRPFPDVSLVDMRSELEKGNRNIFSYKLQRQMEDSLNNDEQIMLFINRRGFSTFVSCRSCGHVMECPQCKQILTFHAKKKRLICHQCGYTEAAPKVCPACGSVKIRYFGIGTEQIQQAITKRFPNIGVLRMDRDSTGRKGSHKEIVNSMHTKDAQVLIGTQMIVKGHDFPGVSTVGILAADMSLYIPSFKAAENTFQLIMQMAGRAGRHENNGQVILQTYSPDHYAIERAANNDYKGFYKDEIALRKAFYWPPFWEIMEMELFPGKNPEKGYIKVDELYQLFNEFVIEKGIDESLYYSYQPILQDHNSKEHPQIFTWMTKWSKTIAVEMNEIWNKLWEFDNDVSMKIKWKRTRW
ncbi:MAG: primosomal protein N' [Tissierellia bacterium]|nr:primosomal protein N' [Tissierellia bacterium]